MSSFSYNPKDANSVLPEGEYEASILSVKEGTSQNSGAPMLTVTFTVYGEDRTPQLRDWIVNPSTLWKLKKLAEALGKLDEFNGGEWLPEEGANLRVKLSVEDDPNYGEQNRITGYLADKPSGKPRTQRKPAAAGATHTPISEDDIPF